MVNAHKIVFNKLSSDEFDVTLHCNFDGNAGTTSSFLNRDNIHTEHYDGRRVIYKTKYNEVLTPRFTIIKQDFSDFSDIENRKILSWLTSSDKPTWLEVYTDDGEAFSWRCFGNIINIEQYKLGSARVVGYEFEMETTHPYAWSPTHEIIKGHSDETTFDLTCNSDEYNKVLYPKVTITFNNDNIYFPIDKNPISDTSYNMIPYVVYAYHEKEGEEPRLFAKTDEGSFEIWAVLPTAVASSYTKDKYYYFPSDQTIKKTVETTSGYAWETVNKVGSTITITNEYELNGESMQTEMLLKGCVPGETITLDGTNKVISSDQNEIVKIIGDNFNWEWLPLAYENNHIIINGTECEVKIEWMEPRKVGDL